MGIKSFLFGLFLILLGGGFVFMALRESSDVALQAVVGVVAFLVGAAKIKNG